MAERKREGMTPPALGGSSLLVAFAVLALTVFALLSLSTVQADVRLADASAQAVSDYYAADCEAQEILARLRSGETVEGLKALEPTPEDLERAVETAEKVSSLYKDADSVPPDQGGRSAPPSPGGAPYLRSIGYAVPISDTQELQAVVVIYGDGSYEIVRWQAVPTVEWEPDDTLDLWDGIE